MSSTLITVFNMSITATYVAFVVMIIRQLIRRAPKIFSYALWAIVLFRLVCPISFESSFSLIHNKLQPIAPHIVYSQNPAIDSGIEIVDHAVNQSIQSSLNPPSPAASVNPMGIVMEVVALIWVFGIVLLLGYGAMSYLRLKQRLTTATLLKENILETDRIKTPFVLGFIRPKIYVPTGLSPMELDYILKHEKTHIRRGDHLIKPVAYLALVLHWFNPIIWVSYFLMAKDVEMSCDESVLGHSSEDIRISYSNSLLSLSVRQSGLLSPIAFGESNVKSRIRNVLNYKKPSFWILVIGVAAVAIASLALMANPSETSVLGSGENAHDSQGVTDNGEKQWLSDAQSAAVSTLGLRGGYFSEAKGEPPHLTLEYRFEHQKVLIEMNQVSTDQEGIWEVKSHETINIPISDTQQLKEENASFPLDFSEVHLARVTELQVDQIQVTVQEKKINNDIMAFLYRDREKDGISAGIRLNNQYFSLGEVSEDSEPNNRTGLQATEVFGRKAVKFYGALGANYGLAYYWFIEGHPKATTLQVDGNTEEVDLNNDGKTEILSTSGTIPEAKIYKFSGEKILVADINQSIAAKAVTLVDRERKIFEVYFEPQKPQHYIYSGDSFQKVIP